MNAVSTTGSYSKTTSNSSRSASTQRLVRSLGGASPFVWRGLLPLLGLAGTIGFALAPFAANDIEAAVATQVRGELQARGHAWANVAVSGQEVFLSGSPPLANSGEEALAIARGATCPTWSGRRVCAVAVFGAFGAAPAAGVPQATLPPAGMVSAPATGAALPVASAPAAAACDAAFAKLLEGSRIEFTSGGSAIDARSARLLDQLAETARNCPGRVLIEGHTDNVGDAESNQRLSEARAAAVRAALVQRGLPPDRLETAGHGATKPLADNDSAAGRAANRRIDFRAVP
jgi:outer membrane protein OmpA-like peptidoglycan-associated protein